MTKVDPALIYSRVSQGETYEQVGLDFGLSSAAARGRARRYAVNNDLPPASHVKISGGYDERPKQNGEELWKRTLAIQEREDANKEWRAQRSIGYESGPLALVFMADLHLGSAGVDYRSIDHDITILNCLANSGVNVGVILVGDMIDNFIIGKLQRLRMTESPFLVVEEWQLVDYALERLTPFLLGSVAGNHDNWSWALSGVDLLAARHKAMNPGILYDPTELAFNLSVGDFETRVMCRHQWRGNSMYNPTHGLEHGHHTRGREFDIAVGAHTHRGGLAREFANGKDVGHALICGSYKKTDSYAMLGGYAPPMPTSAVAVVMDEGGILFSTSQIEGLARVLKSL